MLMARMVATIKQVRCSLSNSCQCVLSSSHCNLFPRTDLSSGDWGVLLEYISASSAPGDGDGSSKGNSSVLSQAGSFSIPK